MSALTVLQEFVTNHMSLLQTSGGILLSALVTGTSVRRMLTAVAQVCGLVAQEELGNAEKRQKAMDLLYTRYPVIGTIIPEKVMGALVDMVWVEFAKSLVEIAPAPAPKP